MMNNPKDAFYQDIYIPTLIRDFNKVLTQNSLMITSYAKDGEEDKLYLFVSDMYKQSVGIIVAYSHGLDSRYDWIVSGKIVRFYHLAFMQRFFYEAIERQIAAYDENENLMYKHIDAQEL